MAADSTTSAPTHRHRRLLPPTAVVGIAVALLAIILIACFSWLAMENRQRTVESMQRSTLSVSEIRGLLSELQDAETGQRGYLLVGTEIYLTPYNRAKAGIGPQIQRLRALVADDAQQVQRLDALETLAVEKMRELEDAVVLYRGGNREAALALVQTNRGRVVMDNLRALVAEMLRAEAVRQEQQQALWETAVTWSTVVQVGGAALLLLLLAVAAMMISRDYVAREMQIWLRAGQAGLAGKVQGEQRLEVLGDGALGYLAHYLQAQVGALYLAEPQGVFRRVAGYGVPADAPLLHPGEGLLGQAAKSRTPQVVHDLPEGYLPLNSTLGRGRPQALLAAPAVVDGQVHALVELGFTRRLDAADIELMAQLSQQLGVAVRSARDRSQLEALLEETQRQAEELQAQQEELRVNNEELEEQSRALNQSQLQLQNQQAELEQTNVQLEEQTHLLEGQRDELTRSQNVLAAKAQELERANQYKSEFLANMSHELRTPLNSTLILAKLLADNKGGNLTPEQVKYASTIISAGNDLLLLINDILDLSKIEAGKMDLHLDAVPLRTTVDTLVRSMQPQASQKGLQLDMVLAPGLPEHIVTDAQRLGQILKNLVSNACKFTSQGSVTVTLRPESADRVAIEVRDTGIGIAPDHQDMIFEAFRQADGSTHRKYGGTGLGLSISRDLAQLLGGTLTVHSVLGAGSTFTLCLPRLFSAPQAPAPHSGAGLGADATTTVLPHAPAVAAVPAAAPVPAARQNRLLPPTRPPMEAG